MDCEDTLISDALHGKVGSTKQRQCCQAVGCVVAHYPRGLHPLDIAAFG